MTTIAKHTALRPRTGQRTYHTGNSQKTGMIVLGLQLAFALAHTMQAQTTTPKQNQAGTGTAVVTQGAGPGSLVGSGDAANPIATVNATRSIQNYIYQSGTSTGGVFPSFLNDASTYGFFARSGSDHAFFGIDQEGTSNRYHTVIYFGDDTDDDLLFRNEDNGELMRLTGGGKLGLGYNSPAYKLDVNGTGKFSSVMSMGKYYYTNGTNGWYTDDPNNQLVFGHNNNGLVYLNTTGQLGIGTAAPAAALHVVGDAHIDGSYLRVNGEIKATEITVTTDVWADYVFEPGYRLRSLPEVAAFIAANGHLPEVPAASTALAQGINVAEMNVLLLQKIEELTLYMIQLQQQNTHLQQQVDLLAK